MSTRLTPNVCWQLLLRSLCCFALQVDLAVADNNPNPITITTIAAYKGLCRSYTVKLSDAYLAALEDAYSSVLSSRLAAAGSPDVLFDPPIGPTDNTAEVTGWSICIPVFIPEGSAAAVPYKFVDVPQTDAVRTTCGQSDDDRQSCADAISSYLLQNNLYVSRMSQVSPQSDGTVVVTAAVSVTH
jgi:hypothetical protein